VIDALHHDLAAAAVELACFSQMRVEIPAAKELRTDELERCVGLGVGRDLDVIEFFNDFRRREHVAQTRAGREDFGEAVGKNGVACFVKGLDGRQFLPGEADIPVRIVLQDDDVIPAADLGQTFSAFQRQRPAAGIVESWDNVDKFRVQLLIASSTASGQIPSSSVLTGTHLASNISKISTL
jgi:hypothetical protein